MFCLSASLAAECLVSSSLLERASPAAWARSPRGALLSLAMFLLASLDTPLSVSFTLERVSTAM